MYKQSPSRNHRSKGVKVKNVLQICLLLAVGFWLIYQVKHSHDKKKEFDEDDAKSLIKTESSNELMKLGRKDLPRIEGLDTVKEKHREEPEDETVEEEEGNKPEEEDLEEKNDEHREDGEDEVDDHDQEKNDEHREDGEDEVDDHDQEKNDEHIEDGEDEVDDHDHEKSDVERDQEEDAVDEDKERGEDNEKETEEIASELNDSQVEEENSLEDHDHDEDSSSSHEAREEHYKADDASSAVTHDTVVTTNENGKIEQEAEHAADAKSEVGVKNIMQINASQNTTVALKVEDGKADGEDSPPNTTNSEEKHDDPISSTAADISVSNSTRTKGLTDNSESRTHSTELSTQTHDLFLQNGTQAVNREYNATVVDTTSGGSNISISTSQQNGNSADTVDDNQVDSNLTLSSKNDELDSISVDSSNVSGDKEPSLAEKVVQVNATVEAVDIVGLPLKDNNAIEVEKADTSSEERGTTDEGGDASIAEGEVQDDLIDASDSSTHLEEKHVRTDVETLPEIQTEGNMEDAAAE